MFFFNRSNPAAAGHVLVAQLAERTEVKIML